MFGIFRNINEMLDNITYFTGIVYQMFSATSECCVSNTVLTIPSTTNILSCVRYPPGQARRVLQELQAQAEFQLEQHYREPP